LLDRAGTFFQNGDFESARLIYAELADRGSGRAAWRMAQTFDPDVLKSFFVVGVEPNSEKAKLWYSRAAERGVAEARERLKVLSKAEPR
jgi:TPR repeat protein